MVEGGGQVVGQVRCVFFYPFEQRLSKTYIPYMGSSNWELIVSIVAFVEDDAREGNCWFHATKIKDPNKVNQRYHVGNIKMNSHHIFLRNGGTFPIASHGW